jgi:hypothetical protein
MQNKHDLCNKNTCPYKRDLNHISHYGNRPAWLSVKEHTPAGGSDSTFFRLRPCEGQLSRYAFI